MTPFQNNCSDFEKLSSTPNWILPKIRARSARKIGFLGQTTKSRSFGNPRVCQILGEENPDPNSDFNFKENWEIRSPKELDDFDLKKKGHFYIPGTVCG